MLKNTKLMMHSADIMKSLETKSVHYKNSYLSGNALAAAQVFCSGGSFFYQTAAAAAANEEFCFSYLW
jgi:hypothetical protein